MSKDFYDSQYVYFGGGLSELKEKYDLIFSLLRGIIGENVLDLGCGCGEFARVLAKEFNIKHIFGVDIDKVAVNSALEKGIQASLCNIDTDKLPYQNGFFDTIFCGDIIEHLTNPDHLLEECYRLLKNDGYLMIVTPNLASWYNRILLLVGFQPIFTEVSIKYAYNKPIPVGLAGHLRLYTYDSLKFILEKNNFKLVKASGIGINERIGFGHKHLFLVKILNAIFNHVSVNSNLCLLVQKK